MGAALAVVAILALNRWSFMISSFGNLAKNISRNVKTTPSPAIRFCRRKAWEMPDRSCETYIGRRIAP
jgi:hypothetical protein